MRLFRGWRIKSLLDHVQTAKQKNIHGACSKVIIDCAGRSSQRNDWIPLAFNFPVLFILLIVYVGELSSASILGFYRIFFLKTPLGLSKHVAFNILS